MLIQTILNRVHKIKGFVYGKICFGTWESDPSLEVKVHPRKGSQGICSQCGKKSPGYDTQPERRFEFIPLWGYRVFLLYKMRRVNCTRCGIKIEKVPWAVGKQESTTTYKWFLANWAKRLSWQEVAKVFHSSWYRVQEAVEMAVEWGRQHMELEGITAIGIDEIQVGKGHTYLTLVYQINEGARRLLWVGEKRKVKTLLRFFRWLGEARTARLQFICSDMWKPYLKVVQKKAGQAIHILDRFHIVAHLNKAIDEVRAQEARDLKKQGKGEILKRSRWLFLKLARNLKAKQVERLAEILKHNLRTVRSYLLKEEFQLFWEYKSAWWAGRFLDDWCNKTMRSRIEPMKKVAKMLQGHRELILNYFRAKKEFSSGVVEGLNNKAKLTMKKAYGYKSFRTVEIALYHTLGNLPEPEFTHRFF
ncbi:MAG: ISL3 family transposase [bacterium]|jgi:transposase